VRAADGADLRATLVDPDRAEVVGVHERGADEAAQGLADDKRWDLFPWEAAEDGEGERDLRWRG
jgi:hypothetical protein